MGKKAIGIGISFVIVLLGIVMYFQWNYVIVCQIKWSDNQDTSKEIEDITGIIVDKNKDEISIQDADGNQYRYNVAGKEQYTSEDWDELGTFEWNRWELPDQSVTLGDQKINSLQCSRVEQYGSEYLQLCENGQAVGYGWLSEVEKVGEDTGIRALLAMHGFSQDSQVKGISTYAYTDKPFPETVVGEGKVEKDIDVLTGVLRRAKSGKKDKRIFAWNPQTKTGGIELFGSGRERLRLNVDFEKGTVSYKNITYQLTRAETKLVYSIYQKSDKTAVNM